MSDRREFFKKIGLLGLSGIATKLVSSEQLNALENLGKQSVSSTPFIPVSYTHLTLPTKRIV